MQFEKLQIKKENILPYDAFNRIWKIFILKVDNVEIAH